MNNVKSANMKIDVLNLQFNCKVNPITIHLKNNIFSLMNNFQNEYKTKRTKTAASK